MEPLSQLFLHSSLIRLGWLTSRLSAGSHGYSFCLDCVTDLRDVCLSHLYRSYLAFSLLSSDIILKRGRQRPVTSTRGVGCRLDFLLGESGQSKRVKHITAFTYHWLLVVLGSEWVLGAKIELQKTKEEEEEEEAGLKRLTTAQHTVQLRHVSHQCSGHTVPFCTRCMDSATSHWMLGDECISPLNVRSESWGAFTRPGSIELLHAQPPPPKKQLFFKMKSQ